MQYRKIYVSRWFIGVLKETSFLCIYMIYDAEYYNVNHLIIIIILIRRVQGNLPLLQKKKNYLLISLQSYGKHLN